MKRFTILFSAVFFTLFVSAQILSLDSCISMALRANRQIENARLLTRQRDYTMASMKANFLPNFKVSARDLYSSADGSLNLSSGYLPTFIPGTDGTMQPNVMTNPATGQPMMQADGVTPVFQQYAYFPGKEYKYKIGNVILTGISVEQPIYMGGKITAGYKMSQLASSMARQNERLTKAQVIVNTEEAYALLVRATEMRVVALLYDSLLQTLKHDVVAARAHGLASYNDVLKVDVKKNEAELQLHQTENALRLARMNLCRQIALPLDTPIDAVTQSPSQVETGTEFVAAGIDFQTMRPEAIMLDQKVQLADQKVRIERAEFLPQVGIMAGYSYLYGVKVNESHLFDVGNFAALLNVSIPLYHFGEGRNKVRAARMEAEQARVEQQDMLDQMRLEVTREANNVDEARLELEVTTRSLEQATENLRMARKSYDAGMESLSDLLEAQTLYQKALASQVEARCQLSLAITRYRKATGQL